MSIGGIELRDSVCLLDSIVLLQVDVDNLFNFLVEEMLDLVELFLLLLLYVLDLRACGKEVAQSHSETISDDRSDAEAEDVAGRGAGCDSTEDDDESVDASIQSPVDERLQILPSIDVELLMLLEALGCGKQGIDEVLRCFLHVPSAPDRIIITINFIFTI